MLNPLRSSALALLLVLLPSGSALLAQSLFFGEAVPQTHTRYGSTGAEPLLVTNGRDFFLFWANESKVRVTRLVDGQKRAGRPVLDVDHGWFDVVWTGTHFLVAAYDLRVDGTQEIRGRLLNANGEPVSAAFTIVSRGGAPHLAFDGARVLMVYRGGMELSSVLLRPDGVQATDPRHQVIASASAIEGVVAAGGPGFVAASAHPDNVRITTLHPTSEVAVAHQHQAPTLPQRRVAIGSNGGDVLVVWTNGTSAMDSVMVKANGTIGGRTAIPGTEGAVTAAVAWNGTKWVVSTIVAGKLQSRFVDGSGPLHTPNPAHAASPVSVASLKGRTLAAFRGTAAGQPVLVRDLAASSGGETAAFAAAEQTFHTATWSHEAALAVWSELRDGKRTLHAGVRTVDGGWLENKIGNDEDAPLAASDGNNFLVVRKTNAEWSAVTLSNTAQILASTPLVGTFTPTGITWDGTAWAIIGLSPQRNIYAVRVMPWGAVSAPVLIQERSGTEDLENPRIVSGGGGFLAVWQVSESVPCFPVCDPYSSVLHGVRLTANLQRVDMQNLAIAPDEAVSPAVYWDGNRFVIFWIDDGALETRTVRPNASGSGTTRVAGAQVDTRELYATLTPFGAAITSNDGEVLLVRDGVLVERYPLGVPNSTDAVVNLGPGVAYLQAAVRDEMPYHGASHIFLSAGGVLPPANRPLPPKIVRASMTNGGNLIVLEWTAPLDPINGYRIEYRVDDGLWNEFDEWFDAETTSVSIRPWLDKVQYHFRIRAWSDAGVSEYSLPATVRLLGRRRAVR
ncbi:MAG: fibronectin type III domain-containing protein [Thermoanaerobaculia bacterium]